MGSPPFRLRVRHLVQAICGTQQHGWVVSFTILQSLHNGYPGITRIKAIAHSYFWWNGLDRNIEELANYCDSCQAVK